MIATARMLANRRFGFRVHIDDQAVGEGALPSDEPTFTHGAGI